MLSLSLGPSKCSLHVEDRLPKTVVLDINWTFTTGTVFLAHLVWNDKHLPFLSESNKFTLEGSDGE